MMRGGMDSGMRKGMAGLFALLLFVLFSVSAVPASAWPAAPAGHADGFHAVADCRPHDAAVPASLEQEPRRGHHDQVPAALACCAALHCPMPLADLQPAPAAALVPAGLRVRAAVTVQRLAGVEIAPALRPPRGAV